MAVINDLAQGLVRSDQQYGAALDDPDRSKANADFRNKVFLFPRPLQHYLDALGGPASPSATCARRRSRPALGSGTGS